MVLERGIRKSEVYSKQTQEEEEEEEEDQRSAEEELALNL